MAQSYVVRFIFALLINFQIFWPITAGGGASVILMTRNAVAEEISILCGIGCADNNVSHHCLIIRGCQLLTCHMGLQWLSRIGMFLEVRIYPIGYILKEVRIWQEMGDL